MSTQEQTNYEWQDEVGRTIFEGLNLDDEEFAAVRRQGFVSRETRKGRTTVFKLRFRVNGQQRVKFVTTNPVMAAALERELRQLQRSKDKDLTLRSLNREASQLLRQCKTRLAPLVEQAGLRFHGRALRCPRS